MRPVYSRLRYLLLAITFVVCMKASAAQEPPQVQPEAALKERATAYFQALLKGDLVTALAYVAPESRNDFIHANHEGILEAHITSVDLTSEGEAAKVKSQVSVKPDRFHQTLDYQLTDTWKRIDGNWYMVLTPPKDLQTPFGTFTAGRSDSQSSAAATPKADVAKSQGTMDVTEVQKRAQERLKNADPDQYIKALQKAQKDQEAAAKQNPPKTDDKKKPADAKKKTDQTADPKPKQDN